MGDCEVSDAQIAAMSAVERRDLILRLERPLDELPLAFLLISGSLRILRLIVTRLYLLDPGMPLWRVPLLP